jgi:hypothetical protein
MCAYANSPLFCHPNCPIHDDRITGMKAACDVRGADDLHQRGIVADSVRAVSFAHIRVYVDLHGLSLLWFILYQHDL